MPAPWPMRRHVLAAASLAALAAVGAAATAAAAETASFAYPSRFGVAEANALSQAAASDSRAWRATSDRMVLGSAAPAPLGYLRFCARRPDQCGLEGDAWAGLRAKPVDERADDLVAEYYWAVAFAGGRARGGRLTPTSDDVPVRGAPTASAAPSAASGEPDAAAPAATPDLAPLPLDRRTAGLLNDINMRINAEIRFVSDRTQFGVDDYWTLPLDRGGSGAGECKDYVLEKRRALIAAGIPAADLSIAIVKTAWGETHAVLLVATERGDVVMDSLSPGIRPWRQAPYHWIERQAPGRQLVWVSVLPDSRRG